MLHYDLRSNPRKKDFKRRDPKEHEFKPEPRPKPRKVRKVQKSPEVKLTKKFQDMVSRNKQNSDKRQQFFENLKQEEKKRALKHKQNVKNFRKYWKAGEQGASPEDLNQPNGAMFAEEEVEGDQCAAPLGKDSENKEQGNILGMFKKNKSVFGKLRKNIGRKVLDKPKLMESFGLRSRVLNMFYLEVYK